MNWDQIKGSWKSKARQIWGDLPDEHDESLRDALADRLRAKYGYTQEKAEEEAEGWLRKLDELDEALPRSIVKSEPSPSATSEREKRIGEDYCKDASRGVHLPLEGRADEPSERGEEAMHPATPLPPEPGGTPLEKHSPRSPAFQLDMGTLTANAMKRARRTTTVEEIEATLRREKEEYLRRYPNNVPPPSDA
jgi:hypothetical protein